MTTALNVVLGHRAMRETSEQVTRVVPAAAASASQRLPPDALETWIDLVIPENLFPTGTLLPPTPSLSHPAGGSVQTQR
jgi:hypothetical protein